MSDSFRKTNHFVANIALQSVNTDTRFLYFSIEDTHKQSVFNLVGLTCCP